MKCEICNQGPPTGPAIYRVNKPGEMPARWRCNAHMTAEQAAAIDPEVRDITEAIETSAPNDGVKRWSQTMTGSAKRRSIIGRAFIAARHSLRRFVGRDAWEQSLDLMLEATEWERVAKDYDESDPYLAGKSTGRAEILRRWSHYLSSPNDDTNPR